MEVITKVESVTTDQSQPQSHSLVSHRHLRSHSIDTRLLRIRSRSQSFSHRKTDSTTSISELKSGISHSINERMSKKSKRKVTKKMKSVEQISVKKRKLITTTNLSKLNSKKITNDNESNDDTKSVDNRKLLLMNSGSSSSSFDSHNENDKDSKKRKKNVKKEKDRRLCDDNPNSSPSSLFLSNTTPRSIISSSSLSVSSSISPTIKTVTSKLSTPTDTGIQNGQISISGSSQSTKDNKSDSKKSIKPKPNTKEKNGEREKQGDSHRSIAVQLEEHYSLTNQSKFTSNSSSKSSSKSSSPLSLKRRKIDAGKPDLCSSLLLSCENLCRSNKGRLNEFHSQLKNIIKEGQTLNDLSSIECIRLMMTNIFKSKELSDRVYAQVSVLGPNGRVRDQYLPTLTRDAPYFTCSLCNNHSFLSTICTNCKVVDMETDNLKAVYKIDWDSVRKNQEFVEKKQLEMSIKRNCGRGKGKKSSDKEQKSQSDTIADEEKEAQNPVKLSKSVPVASIGVSFAETDINLINITVDNGDHTLNGGRTISLDSGNFAGRNNLMIVSRASSLSSPLPISSSSSSISSFLSPDSSSSSSSFLSYSASPSPNIPKSCFSTPRTTSQSRSYGSSLTNEELTRYKTNCVIRSLEWANNAATRASQTDFDACSGDMIFLFRHAIFRTENSVRLTAEKCVKSMLDRWEASDCSLLDKYCDSEALQNFAECLHAKAELSKYQTTTVANITPEQIRRSTISLTQSLSQISCEDILRFRPDFYSDSLPQTQCQYCHTCGEYQLVGYTVCPTCSSLLQYTNDLEAICEALVWSDVFNDLSIDAMIFSDHINQISDVLKYMPLIRPYEPLEILAKSQFMLQLYFITHLILTVSGWEHIHLLSDELPYLFAEEILFLLSNMDTCIKLKDPELVGEILQSLRILGVPQNDICVMRGTCYLLSTERSGKMAGNWQPTSAGFYKKYHTAFCGIIGMANFKPISIKEFNKTN